MDVIKSALLPTVLVAVLAGIVLIYYSQTQPYVAPTTTTVPATTTIPTTTTTVPVALEKGKLVIALKDSPIGPTTFAVYDDITGEYKLAGGAVVRGLNLNVSGIMVHRVIQGGGNETNETNETDETGGWVSVSEGEKSLDLMKYTDIIAIVGEGILDAGKYTQVRLNISNASIVITNTYAGIWGNKTYPMYVPSHELKLAHQFTIEQDKTVVLTLDFDVENSVSHTADGYTLKPVVKVIEETLGANARPANSESV